MQDEWGYVPILRMKKAELDALEDTADDVKDSMTPLLELVPLPGEAEGEAGRPLVGYLDTVAARIGHCWGSGRPVFIDVSPLVSDRDVDAGVVLRLAAEAAEAQDVTMVPVTASGRPPAFQQAVAAVSSHDPAVCVRLDAESFEDLWRLPARMQALLAVVGVDPSQAHLVVDLQGSQALALALYTMVPRLDEWGAVTLVSGAFPASLGQLPQGDISRDDWALWRDVPIPGGLPLIDSPSNEAG